MSTSTESLVCQGGCHCGAVRFQVLIDRYTVDDCNCSICRKKGFLHLIVPPENFTLLKGRDSLSCYTFNTKVAQHTFCSICGIHSFYRPRSHPNMVDINIRCLDEDLSDTDDKACGKPTGNVLRFTIRNFDGKNWENNVEQIR